MTDLATRISDAMAHLEKSAEDKKAQLRKDRLYVGVIAYIVAPILIGLTDLLVPGLGVGVGVGAALTTLVFALAISAGHGHLDMTGNSDKISEIEHTVGTLGMQHKLLDKNNSAEMEIFKSRLENAENSLYLKKLE